MSLTRSKTGLWKGRKEIPAAIREAYGKREEKSTWPAHLTEAQALAEYMQWRAKIESDIDLHKQRLSGDGLMRLTRQQARAVAGGWYRDAVQGEGDDGPMLPGWEADWEATRTNLFSEVHDEATGGVRYVPGPVLVEERDALLTARSMKVTDDSAAFLLEELGELYLAYFARRGFYDDAAQALVQPGPPHTYLKETY